MNRTLAATVAVLAFAPAAGAGLDWERIVEIAAGAGQKGAWRQNDSRYDYVDDAAAAFAGGEVLVAWADQARKDVFLRRVPGGRPPGAPVDVSRSPATFSWQPRIAVAQADPRRVYLIWQEIIFSGGSHGGEILFARSTDGGAHFGEALNLSRSPGGDGKGRLDRASWSNGSHDLAIGANGELLVAWTEYHGALWFARSTDGGASFTAPRQVAGSLARPARAPSLAAGPAGQVFLAWTVGEDAAADIHLAASADGGAHFGAPRRVGAGPGHADAPRLAVDGKGGLHLVYAEALDGPGGRYRVRYASSTDGGARFGTPRTLSDVRPGAGSAGYPAIGTDARDKVYVIWESTPAGTVRPQALQFAVSPDAGQHFSAPAPIPGSAAGPGAANGSHQGLLGQKLAVDPAGRLAVVNSSMLPGRHSRVWLMQGRPGPGARR